MKDLFAQWSKVAWCFLALFLSGVVSLYSIVYGLASAVIHSGDVMYSHAVVAYETHVMAAAEARGLTPGVVNVGEPKLTRDEIIEREAKTNKVHPDLIRAIIGKESGGNPWVMGEDATPTTGARGLMQVVCSNVKAAGLKNCNEALDEETNIRLGSWVLGSNMRQTGEDPYKALVVYRVGPRLTSAKCDTACAERYAKDVMIRFATREFNKTFIKERT